MHTPNIPVILGTAHDVTQVSDALDEQGREVEWFARVLTPARNAVS